MAGGYITVLLMNRAGVPFLACLPIAFVGTALLGALLERTLYRPMYARPHLDQVLFSIGLVFMAVTAVDYVVGSMQQNIHLPDAQAQTDVAQWKPIVAWLEPILRVVRRPELRGNPSVERPAPVPGEPAASRAVGDDATTIVAAEPAPPRPVVAAPASNDAATPLAPRPTIVEPMARPAPVRLGLFGWLTPRFLHR